MVFINENLSRQLYSLLRLFILLSSCLVIAFTMDSLRRWASNSFVRDADASSFDGACIVLYVLRNVLSFKAIITPEKNKERSVSLTMSSSWNCLFNALSVLLRCSSVVISLNFAFLYSLFMSAIERS